MLTRDHAFLVLGDPIQQGSMKCWGKRGPRTHALESDNKDELLPWREKVAAGARSWVDEAADKHQPVMLFITYTVHRPNDHYGTGRNAGVLKERAVTAFPVALGTKDIDKLERAILDALAAGGALDNDAQVVDVAHKKRFVRGDPRGLIAPDHRDILPVPGVVIRLHPLGDDDV